jgi:hypothetical protein
MAKKSGSKSSRSERRAGRKRAERAVEHGLPTRQQPPRARSRSAKADEPSRSGEGTTRASDAAPASVAKSSGIPTLVKVLGAALVILLGVYLLSRQRDEALTENVPAAEVPVVAASAAPTVEAAAAEPNAPSPAPEVTAVPQPPGAVVPITPPTMPVVSAPLVPAPAVSPPGKPRVEKARLAPSPPPIAIPAAPAPVAAPAAPAPPAPAPATPAPAKPAAPKAPPAAPPVDNPY